MKVFGFVILAILFFSAGYFVKTCIYDLFYIKKDIDDKIMLKDELIAEHFYQDIKNEKNIEQVGDEEKW